MQVRFWRSMFVFARIQNDNARAANFCAHHPFGTSSLLDSEAVTRALKWCRQTQSLSNGESLHAQVIQHGLCPDIYISNNLISMYGEFNSCRDANKIFDEMPKRNVVTWTSIISSNIHAGKPSEALRMFTDMLEYGSEMPNSYTFSAVLKACAMVRDLDMGKRVHEHIQRGHLQSDTVLMNAVLDMYVKCDSLADARKVFDIIFPLTFVSWNTMISGYCNGGKLTEAENLFCRIPLPDSVSFNTMVMGFAKHENPKALYYVTLMHKLGFKLDCFTFPCALQACGSLRDSGMGKQIHSYIMRCGYQSGLHIGPSLVDMYGNCGHVDVAMKLFGEYSLAKYSPLDRLSLLNSMLAAFANNGYDMPALNLVSKISSSDFNLDAFTLSMAARACMNLNLIRVGIQVHGLIVTTGCHLDHVVGSILLELYAKLGNFDYAVKMFVGLPQKDLISWTGMITHCVQKGLNRLALHLFRNMIHCQCEADHFVFSIVLKACAALSWLQSGVQVHTLCIKGGFEMESVIITSLIDIYSKCGGIEDALRLFETATEKDTVSWTAMIVSCGNNGRAHEAVQLFHQMLESGVEPNEITFIGVLSACKNADRVGEASSFFRAMELKHGLRPSLEHYCCMVDILGRAGLFDEAKQLITEMPYESDETVWNSLLGASAMHQNISMARLALEHLHLISGKETPGLVSLSNVYAGLDLWDYSADVRKLVRSVGMKEPGRSWTEARYSTVF